MSGEVVRILVVDDDAAGRYIKAHTLRRAGYQVLEAESGAIALTRCAADPPHMVVLDTRLPDIGGTEVCRRIKASQPQIAVLQTSAALSTAHDRAQALDGGADTFLVEPIEPEELVATARALLRMRGAEQELRRLNESLEDMVLGRTAELAAATRRLEVESSERQKAEDVVRHSQKLEAVGQLTGGVAHDFNNLLAVILASLGMVRASVEGRREYTREKLLHLITAAESAADRGTKVTQQLLAFSRRSVLTTAVVVVDEVLASCELFLRRALGETIALAISGDPAPWSCRVDPVQFETAVLNLLVNARDAMPEGGTLSIATANVEINGGPPLPGGPRSGHYVRIRVADTGTGMDPEIVKHIFEPFFTTKDVGRGTGLGLSQVYGFVTQSGGHIAVETAPDEGSAFIIHLPRCEKLPAMPDAAVEPGGVLPTGNETVLVVEDNQGVRDLAVMTIADLGYRVLSASDGPSALELLRGSEPIDLLFSDVVMPGGMNGFELVRQAGELRRGIKALVTTGYANVRDREALATVEVLAKPYGPAELARRLRTVLDVA